MKVNNSSIQTMRWADGKFEMIDQRILPSRFEYISYDSAESVAEGIKTMVVRGAPAIGCAAAFGIALEGLKLNKENNKDYLKNIEIAFKVLSESRPTAVNLFWALAKMKKVLNENITLSLENLSNLLLQEAIAIME